MPVQGSVHNVQRAPRQTLGTRTRRRGRADAARSEPASHACAPRNRRASVRHAEDADGCDALSNEAFAKCRDRNGAERTPLHPHPRNEHRRHQAAPGGNPGVKSSCCYAHRVTVQVARRSPRLTPDSIQQKYAQTVVSTRIVPGCVRFLGEENRFYTAWVTSSSTLTDQNISARPSEADIASISTGPSGRSRQQPETPHARRACGSLPASDA